VGVMPSPFEYPVASPYLGASASGTPDGYFDSREIHQSDT
jgi:hypothetical protein